MKGITIRLYHDPPIADVQALIAQAQAAGATGIALVPTHYVTCDAGSVQIVKVPFGWVWSDTGQAPGLVGNTTPLATVQACAEAVRAAGLDLLLKPHLDIAWHQANDTWGYGGWRGYAEPPDASTWRDAYRAFLRPYVTLAHDTGAALCLGCELYRTTVRFGAGWWQDMARWVRTTRRFRGPLTYASNWGWGLDAEVNRLEALWPALDWIGLDAYYPLADAPTTDPGVLAAGWDRVKAELAPLLARTGKPLWLTEVGYRSDERCMVDPYADPAPDAVPSDAGQLACWRAVHAAWPGVPFIAWESAVPGLEAQPVNMDVLRTPELTQAVFGGVAQSGSV